MDPRSNKIFLYVGDRGVGKTDLCKEVLAVSPQPKKLIVDIFDNPAWRTMKTHAHPEWEATEIPVMPFDMLQRHKAGLYRAFVADEALLQHAIQENCRNTCLVIEDASRYFEAKLNRAQRTYLLNSKQMNLEVHLVFHYLKQIPPNLLLMANYLTIFKTGENSFDKHRFFYPNFQEIFEHVKHSPNPHINVTIRLK